MTRVDGSAALVSTSACPVNTSSLHFWLRTAGRRREGLRFRRPQPRHRYDRGASKGGNKDTSRAAGLKASSVGHTIGARQARPGHAPELPDRRRSAGPAGPACGWPRRPPCGGCAGRGAGPQVSRALRETRPGEASRPGTARLRSKRAVYSFSSACPEPRRRPPQPQRPLPPSPEPGLGRRRCRPPPPFCAAGPRLP